MSSPENNNRPKIGVALGGGGARGLAHIGVLKVLEQHGLQPDYIAGVSMGAMIGSFYSTGVDLGEVEKEAVGLTKAKAIKKLVDLNNPKRSLLKGKKAYKYIKNWVGDSTFKDTRIPFRIIATDLANGEEVVLKRGSLADAVMASISVPGIFPPVKINSRYLVDGGVLNCTPVNVLEEMGADIIIGVDLIIKRKVELDKPSMMATLIQSYEVMRSYGAKTNIEKVNKNAIVVKPHLRGTIDSFKFYNIGKFIESGEKATRTALPRIKKRIKDFEE